MTELPVYEAVREAILFPIKNARILMRRLGIAAAFSFIGTLIIGYVQAERSSVQSGTDSSLGAVYLLGAALLTVGSLMITNGTIQACLRHPLAQKVWSLGNREVSQFAVSLFGVVLILVIGILMMIAYWIVSMVLGATFGIEDGSDSNSIFFVLTVASILVAIPFAMRFVLLPVYVANANQFAVEASWEATRGHFWRIAAILGSISIFYLALWTAGALVSAILLITFAGEPSDATGNWIKGTIDLFAWPFTLYGQIAVCALLGYLYQRLVPEDRKTDNEETLATHT